MTRKAQVVRQLHYVCQSPSPYNDFLFSRLAQAPGVDLTVHYCYGNRPERPWKNEFGRGYRSRVYNRRGGIDWFLIRSVLSDRDAFFLTASWNDPTSQLLMVSLALRGREYAIWNDTPDPAKLRHPIKAVLRAGFLRFAFRHAKAVLGTGPPALAAFAVMGAPHEKLRDLPCFIDNTLYGPPKSGGFRDPVVLGSVGRLAPIKGYDTAFHALALLSTSTKRRYVYQVAGDGPQREYLKRLSERLGIAKNVRIMGWLEPGEIVQFYQSVDIFLHPARFEPFGVVISEALASGLPVIASDQTAAAQSYIKHGHNGFLHRAGDPEDLARCIQLALECTPENLSNLRLRARDTAEKHSVADGIRIIQELMGPVG